MQWTLGDIAERLDADLEGDASVPIRGVAGIVEAEPGDVTFLANPRYAEFMAETRASAVIVPSDYSGKTSAALLRVPNSYLAYVEVLRVVAENGFHPAPGVHPSAVVEEDAVIGPEASIGALCVVEAGARIGARTVLHPGVFVGRHTVIGEDCVLFPNVTVRERLTLGNRVIIHCGAVLGSDGFGYVPHAGQHEKIPQIGSVQVDDDVEIGANVAIDRATTGVTRIERGVKIDNLVHVAHNAVVGESTVLVAQVGISGSTRIGKSVTVGGQAGLAGHLTIGDRAIVAARSGVTKDVPEGRTVSGYPAMEHDRARRLTGYTRKLPSLFDRLRALEERVEELEGRAENIV